MKNYEYQKFNPGEYLDFEKDAVELRYAQARGEAEVAPMFPGRDPMAPVTVTEEQIIAHNKLYNPYDPLYTDPDYARAHGHPGVPAMPGFYSRVVGSVQGFSKDTGDLWYYTNDGSEIRCYQNIYGGMTLTPKNAKPDFKDVTKPGSDLRMFWCGAESDMVDQNGKIVYHGYSNTRDCWRKILGDGEKPTFTENMSEWTTYFPEQHVNTDEDYQKMFDIWDHEVIAGDNTPYWEDVKVGDRLPQTCSEGPITFMHLIAWSSMGTLSLFDRDELRDLKTMKKNYFQDRFGSFLDETALHYSGRNIPGSRMAFYNNTAADVIYRTVTNWMGNYGRVTKYAWRFFPFFKEMIMLPLCADEFNKVPGYEGRDCDRHGSEGDIVIGNAAVIGKYVNELGEHIVQIMCWGENFDGAIIQGCPMEVALPSKESK
jgi:hypothetical protein